MPVYPIAFPADAPATERLTLERNQAVMVSPFNFQTQTVNNAARWQLEWSWPAMTHTEAQTIGAWLDSLNGQIGSFTYAPRNAVGGMPTGRTLATIGYAYNDNISVGGWAANATSTLKAGQYFQIGTQLLRITTVAANADASGRVLIEFAPRLRIAYAVGTAVNFVAPVGTFRLTNSSGTGFTLDPDRAPSFGNITAVEVVQ